MKRIFSCILSFTFISCLLSQECKIPLDETFDSIPFIRFIDRVEETSDVRFFFKPEWLDTIRISNQNKEATLDDILNANLQKTSLSYYIYECNKVILSKDYTYLVHLPDFLFTSGSEVLTDVPLEYNENSFIKIVYQKDILDNDVIVVGDPSKKHIIKYAEVSGYITDPINDIPIVGAVVYIDDLGSATITDANGFYKVRAEKGLRTMYIKSVGKEEKEVKIEINSNGVLNETLEDEAISLKEVYVYADREHNVRTIQLGLEKINASTIKQIPTAMGESDILKMAVLLPGVQTVGEGASGFNVRGGSADQNLILMDNAPIYNSSHLFGFFSAINSELVKDFKLYKSSFPANHGGRLSSVFDVNLKTGNPDKFSVMGGISPVTGKLLVEGPILKDRITFVVGGRSTYSDWVLRQINSPMVKNSKASFYDLNAKLNFNINKKNLLQLGGYKSSDSFKLHADTTYSYSNVTGNLLWKHTFSDRLYFEAAGVFSEYKYNINSTANRTEAFELLYDIKHYEGKLDFTYLLTIKHKLKFGASGIRYQLNPGTRKPALNESNIAFYELPSEQGIESAIYVNDEYKVNNRLYFNLGLRYSFFHSLGPQTVYDYAEDAPRTEESRIDTTIYNSDKVSGTFGFPEFRISGRVQLWNNNSIKASFAQMTQYIHMLTNTMSISPTDIWSLSNPNRPPQCSRQYSIGYYHNFHNNMYETSVETYYKESDHVLEFKPGAQLIMNPDLELDLLEGDGLAYGFEVIVKKKYGKLNGWMSYTYSRSLIKVDSDFEEERINNGDYYPSNYDKPHDFTVVSNYKISRRLAISATMTYNTGRPITYPVGWYNIRGRDVLHYSNRNEYRIPDYFRVDLSISLEGNLKVQKLAHSSWTFSIYNLTGRDNVYSIYFDSNEQNNIRGHKLSIFNQPIPSITCNFRF